MCGCYPLLGGIRLCDCAAQLSAGKPSNAIEHRTARAITIITTGYQGTCFCSSCKVSVVFAKCYRLRSASDNSAYASLPSSTQTGCAHLSIQTPIHDSIWHGATLSEGYIPQRSARFASRLASIHRHARLQRAHFVLNHYPLTTISHRTIICSHLMYCRCCRCFLTSSLRAAEGTMYSTNWQVIGSMLFTCSVTVVVYPDCVQD